MKGELAGGELTAFLLYTMTLAMSIGAISTLFGETMQVIGASHRIFDLIDRKNVTSS